MLVRALSTWFGYLQPSGPTPILGLLLALMLRRRGQGLQLLIELPRDLIWVKEQNTGKIYKVA